MKSVLLMAFHYPPCAGSSGVLRTLKYSRYLPNHGWRPIVLTAHLAHIVHHFLNSTPRTDSERRMHHQLSQR